MFNKQATRRDILSWIADVWMTEGGAGRVEDLGAEHDSQMSMISLANLASAAARKLAALKMRLTYPSTVKVAKLLTKHNSCNSWNMLQLLG